MLISKKYYESLTFERIEGGFKRAFTLVELLIVVVIIGILSVALMSRLTGYLEKTRDLKRVADIEALASAIETYYSQKGVFPLRKHETWAQYFMSYFGSASNIEWLVPTYLNEIPRDPQKSNIIKIHWMAKAGELAGGEVPNIVLRWGKNWQWGYILKPWEYLYQSLKNSQDGCFDAVALVARMETVDSANYIFDSSLPIKNLKEGVSGYWGVTPPSRERELLFIISVMEYLSQIFTSVKAWKRFLLGKRSIQAKIIKNVNTQRRMIYFMSEL